MKKKPSNKRVVEKEKFCLNCEVRKVRQKILSTITGNFGYDNDELDRILKEFYSLTI